MEDEHDDYHSPPTSRRSVESAFYSARLPSHSLHSQDTIPIVAELASCYEQEVEDRLVERLEAQISERLQQEVDRRLFENQKHLAIAQVIATSDDIGCTKHSNYEKKDRHSKIHGIRRTCLKMIFCLSMSLAVFGAGGAYWWLSHINGAITINVTDDSITIDVTDNSSSDTTAFSSAPTSFPTKSNMPSSDISLSRSPSIVTNPNTSESPQLLVNITANPTPSPTAINLLMDKRREYLVTTLGPYVLPDDFAFSPEIYFVNDTHKHQAAALRWMEALDLETDVLVAPVPLLIERYVLAVLYYSTGGDRVWTEPLSFLSSKNVCNWNNKDRIRKSIATGGISTKFTEESTEYNLSSKGVFCKNGPFVTSIEISNNVLEGEVPWELSLLPYLTKIDFDTNKLYGSIPIELSRLNRLQALWFKRNELTGTLPMEFSDAVALASIDLEDNNLSSTLPSELGLLSNLFYISLRLNAFTGSLPSSWQTLDQLRTLDLSGNQFHGTLPEEYGALTQLDSLYFESNRFDGNLPPSFGRLTNLVNFFVDDNLLSGTVPIEYTELINLKYFWFHGNLLTGSVDDTFCDPDPMTGVTNLKSNCLESDLGKVSSQIECSCCITCCDNNGTNCIDSSSR